MKPIYLTKATDLSYWLALGDKVKYGVAHQADIMIFLALRSTDDVFDFDELIDYDIDSQ